MYITCGSLKYAPLTCMVLPSGLGLGKQRTRGDREEGEKTKYHFCMVTNTQKYSTANGAERVRRSSSLPPPLSHVHKLLVVSQAMNILLTYDTLKKGRRRNVTHTYGAKRIDIPGFVSYHRVMNGGCRDSADLSGCLSVHGRLLLT